MFKAPGKIILAFFLAYAWLWIGFLKDKLGWNISNRVELWLLIALSVAFLFQQLWLVLPSPASRADARQRTPVIEGLLVRLLNDYRQLYSRKSWRGNPVVRVNLMLPTRRLLWFKALYIWYTACDGGAVYTDAEKTCPWGKRQGTCGWAWSEATTTVFDSKRSDLKAPAGRLKRRQVEVAGHLKSVLSTPVWDVKKVVGVLNFDSTGNEDETHFLDDDVTRLALAYAQILGPHCFRDGVKRS
ncbi:MAG: hypothetical protein ACREP9_07630 [Candidatus Dormibacteraceae bacterium]